MAWETLKSNDGIYLVNLKGITRIIRSYTRGSAMSKYAKEVMFEKHWIGPDLWTVEVDWDAVRVDTTMNTETELRRSYADAQRSMPKALVGLIDSAILV